MVAFCWLDRFFGPNNNPVLALCLFMNGEFHNLYFQRFCVEENNLSCCVKLWDRNKPHLLPCRSIDDRGVVPRLIAHEIDVRAFFDDELVFVLERVAP